MRGLRLGNKGQMHTVEGLIAAVVMVLVLVLVVKSTAITPLSSSSTNKHVQLELMNMGNDLLTSLDYDVAGSGSGASPLKYSIVSWDGNQFVVDDGTGYSGTFVTSDHSLDSNDLAKALLYTFNKYGVAYDVEIVYIDSNGNTISKKMIWNGDPSDNSVTVSKTLAIHNHEIIAGFNTIIPPLGSTTATDLYNLVDVKITLWRM